MKFFIHRYRLVARSGGAIREGALLKVVNPLGHTGYGDLHPWPEFGDGRLEDHLKELKALRLTPLVEQTLWAAKRDAQARWAKKSLWSSGVTLKNNLIVARIDDHPVASLLAEQQRGFEVVKIKCGRDLLSESHYVNEVAAQTRLKIRLDFNSVTTFEKVDRFLMKLSDTTLQSLEYVEDPCPYDPEHWRALRARIKVAIDQEWDKGGFNKDRRPMCDIVVVKPARRDVEKMVEIILHWGMKLTITSSMDHPVGVAHAMTMALELKKAHGPTVMTAGCLTTGLYEPDAFSAAMPTQGPFVQTPSGTGVGFDSLLEALPWVDIKNT